MSRSASTTQVNIDLKTIVRVQSHSLESIEAMPRNEANNETISNNDKRDQHTNKHLTEDIFKALCMIACIAFGLYLAISAIIVGIDQMRYAKSFNIRGTCNCTGFPNEYIIIELFPCDGITDTDFTSAIHKNESCIVGEERNCFTNDGCDEVIFNKGHDEYEENAIMSYFCAAAAISCTAVCLIGIYSCFNYGKN